MTQPSMELDIDPELTSSERHYHETIERTQSDGSLVKAALSIGAAFYGYRWYMQRQLKKEMENRPKTAKSLMDAFDDVYSRYQNVWMRTIAPHLISGYAAGLIDVHNGALPERVLREIAYGYAWNLGNHINDVTAEAVVSGYQAQLNRKVPPARALNNVLVALGVPPKAMNSLVNVWTTETPKIESDVIPIDHKHARAKLIVDQELGRRASNVGENEIWSVREQAKQIVWMYGVETGNIPSSARRKWITADDERVCPTCGPMDGVEVFVDEKFSVPGYGKIWAPPIHPNCRCDLALDFDFTGEWLDELKENIQAEAIGKSRDAYVRTPEGAKHYGQPMGSKITRDVKPTMTKDAPQMDPLLAEALAKPVVEDKIQGLGQTSSKISSSTGISSSSKISSSGPAASGKISSSISSGEKIGSASTTGNDTKARSRISNRVSSPQISNVITSSKISAGSKINHANKISSDAADIIQGSVVPQPHIVDLPFPLVLPGSRIKTLARDSDGNVIFTTTHEDLWSEVHPEDESDTYSVILSDRDRGWFSDLEEHWEKWKRDQRLKFRNNGGEAYFRREGTDEVVNIYDETLWNIAVEYAVSKDPVLGDQEMITEVEYADGSEMDHVTVREVAEAMIDLNGETNLLIADVDRAVPVFFAATQANMFEQDIQASGHGSSSNPGKWREVSNRTYGSVRGYDEDDILPHIISYVEYVDD